MQIQSGAAGGGQCAQPLQQVVQRERQACVQAIRQDHGEGEPILLCRASTYTYLTQRTKRDILPLAGVQIIAQHLLLSAEVG